MNKRFFGQFYNEIIPSQLDQAKREGIPRFIHKELYHSLIKRLLGAFVLSFLALAMIYFAFSFMGRGPGYKPTELTRHWLFSLFLFAVMLGALIEAGKMWSRFFSARASRNSAKKVAESFYAPIFRKKDSKDWVRAFGVLSPKAISELSPSSAKGLENTWQATIQSCIDEVSIKGRVPPNQKVECNVFVKELDASPDSAAVLAEVDINIFDRNDEYLGGGIYHFRNAAMKLGTSWFLASGSPGEFKKEIEEGQAEEAIIAALNNKRTYFRAGAARLLGEIGDTKGINPLIITLKDGGWGVRPIAAEALKKLTGKDFGKNHKKWRKWWEENKECIAPPMVVIPEEYPVVKTIQEFIADLKDSSEVVQNYSANQLKNLTGEDFGPDFEKWQEWWVQKKEDFLKEFLKGR